MGRESKQGKKRREGGKVGEVEGEWERGRKGELGA